MAIADCADSLLLCVGHGKLNYFWMCAWWWTLLRRDIFITGHIIPPYPQPNALKIAFTQIYPSPDTQSTSKSLCSWPFSLTLPFNVSIQSLHQRTELSATCLFLVQTVLWLLFSRCIFAVYTLFCHYDDKVIQNF